MRRFAKIESAHSETISFAPNLTKQKWFKLQNILPLASCECKWNWVVGWGGGGESNYCGNVKEIGYAEIDIAWVGYCMN